MSDTIDIKELGLTRAEALAALYNASKPQSMGFMHFTPEDMTVAEAQELLNRTDYFDYLQGRVMKVRISEFINPAMYDRDNGEGAALRALEEYATRPARA